MKINEVVYPYSQQSAKKDHELEQYQKSYECKPEHQLAQGQSPTM